MQGRSAFRAEEAPRFNFPFFRSVAFSSWRRRVKLVGTLLWFGSTPWCGGETNGAAVEDQWKRVCFFGSRRQRVAGFSNVGVVNRRRKPGGSTRWALLLSSDNGSAVCQVVRFHAIWSLEMLFRSRTAVIKSAFQYGSVPSFRLRSEKLCPMILNLVGRCTVWCWRIGPSAAFQRFGDQCLVLKFSLD